MKSKVKRVVLGVAVCTLVVSAWALLRWLGNYMPPPGPKTWRPNSALSVQSSGQPTDTSSTSHSQPTTSPATPRLSDAAKIPTPEEVGNVLTELAAVASDNPSLAVAQLRQEAAVRFSRGNSVLNDGSDAAPVHASLLNTPSRSSPAFLGPERTASATDPENDAEVARTSLALAKGYADGIYGPEVWQGDQTWKGGWESYQEVVAIRPAKGDGEKGKWCCSGVLIAKNAVLTADHCFFRECLDEASREGRGNGIVVYFGRGGDTQGKTYNVKKFIRYNGLPIQDARSDLAVLILERDVTDIAPVVIAQNGELDEAKDVVVAGFGIFDDSGKGGERRFARVSRGSPACAGPDDPKNFGCSKGTEFVAAMPLGTQPRQRFDTCDGDSGGPAYVQGPGREDKRLLVGITSRGVRGSISGVCGRGGVYTRLDREEYKQWITGIQEIRW